MKVKLIIKSATYFKTFGIIKFFWLNAFSLIWLIFRYTCLLS